MRNVISVQRGERAEEAARMCAVFADAIQEPVTVSCEGFVVMNARPASGVQSLIEEYLDEYPEWPQDGLLILDRRSSDRLTFEEETGSQLSTPTPCAA